MAQETLVITDPNFRMQIKDIEEQLKQHEAENMARAEKREEYLLNKKGMLDDVLTTAINLVALIKKRTRVR